MNSTKKFEIKYQQGSNILLTTVEATDIVMARYAFYMSHVAGVDIIEIKEVNDES